MKKNVLFLILLAATISSVTAAANYMLYHQGQGTISESISLAEYIDGEQISNGTAIAWGELEPGWNYAKNYTVVNTGNTPVTVILRVSGLPEGWSLTWPGNNTLLDLGESATGNRVLTVPSNATAGSYNWDTWTEAQK